MPFSPPHGINFHTEQEIPIAKLCTALRRIAMVLQSLELSRQQLYLYHDWWEHDGLHFGKGSISFHEFFSFIETPRALLKSTPDDDKVFVGVAPEDAKWYLRFRADWDMEDQNLVGVFAITVPSEAAAMFKSEAVERLEIPLVEEDADRYYQRVIV